MEKQNKFTAAIVIFLAMAPVLAFAATPAVAATTAVSASAKIQAPFYYAAWLPFWQAQSGQEDIALHLDSLNEVSPFSYEVGSGGALLDDLKIGTGAWANWLSAVHDMGIKVMPTLAWFDPTGIYNTLSSGTRRRAMEDRIAALVSAQHFDGIDIDFEGMVVGTRPYYSLLIQGLAQRLHPVGKKLTCTVVPRTPTDALYGGGGAAIYAENYTVLNQYCDEVRIMAYDQQTIDIKLNAAKGDGTLYSPVADPDWVKKVIAETVKWVNPRKVMLGVPTYGYEYQVSWQGGITTYGRVRSFSFFGAMDRADSLGVEPVRNNADELSFSFASTTHIAVSPVLISTVASVMPPLQLATPEANAGLTTFYVSFPDAQSVQDKIALAKANGLRGIVFFKADGQVDPQLWSVLN